jgi:hypothetical protein
VKTLFLLVFFALLLRLLSHPAELRCSQTLALSRLIHTPSLVRHTGASLLKKAGEVWNTLDAEEKKKWDTAAADAKKQYERDYAAYKASSAASTEVEPESDAMPVEAATAVA